MEDDKVVIIINEPNLSEKEQIKEINEENDDEINNPYKNWWENPEYQNQGAYFIFDEYL